LLINLTPCVPLSNLGEGEEKKEGLTPLLDTPLLTVFFFPYPPTQKGFTSLQSPCPKERRENYRDKPQTPIGRVGRKT